MEFHISYGYFADAVNTLPFTHEPTVLPMRGCILGDPVGWTYCRSFKALRLVQCFGFRSCVSSESESLMEKM